MGILSGRDLLTSKYITAEISDSEDRLHYVPIKQTFGDYFLVDIGGKIFAFTLRNARMLVHRVAGAKSFKVIQYDTSNFSSLRPETKGLEHVLKKNSLPKVNMMLFHILKLLGRKEKEQQFEVHQIKDLVEELSEQEDRYPEEVKNIKTFLEGLELEEIVTPVKKITDFIEEDLIATSPSFLGELVPRLQRLDTDHKKISNVPTGPKVAWMKFMLIALIAVMIIFVISYGYEEGWFKTFTDLGKSFEDVKFSIPAPGDFSAPTAKNDKYYQDNFTPQSLRDAIERGEINEDSLPPATKEMVKSIKATP